MNLRIQKVIEQFPSLGIDSLLVNSDPNITYLTEFPASESWFLVTRRKCFYLTDSRYELEAKNGLKRDTQVECYKTSLSQHLFSLLTTLKLKKLGIDERQFTLAAFKQLQKYQPKGIALKPLSGPVEGLREIKDHNEIQHIKTALKFHKAALAYLKGIVKPGKRESDILYSLECFVKKQNLRFSFNPIVASGPNSCLPHAKVTTRKLKNNDVVLIDFGIEYKGYKSDLTRMFFLGKIPPLVTQVNSLVYEAQRKAIATIKEGVTIAEVDFAARNYLEKYGFAKYFGHALGHGVGLEIHESPRISNNNKSNLKSGMIITVEPAVYIPNQFGIRIEDMVLVRKKGSVILSDNIHQ